MIELSNIPHEMIANNLHPQHTTHPGSVLKDEIEFRGLSQRALAEEMGIRYSVLKDILNEKRPLTAEYALLIEAILHIDAEPLLTLQTKYDLEHTRQSASFLSRLAALRHTAALW